MSDKTDLQEQLEQMMSHGIFDAELIAANFRIKGWGFIRDPAEDREDMLGGKFFVRTPEQKQGFVSWFTYDAVQALIGNPTYFVEGKAPNALFLAWIFARELAEILLAAPVNPGNGMPGEVFRGAYEAIVNSA